jgi:hypothetical protein
LTGGTLQEILSRYCCRPFRTEHILVSGFRRSGERRFAPAFVHAAPADEAAATGSAEHIRELYALLAESWDRRDEPVNAYTVLLDALGAVGPGEQPLLSTLERRNPVEATLLNQLLFPLIGDLRPERERRTVEPVEPEPADDIRLELTRLREMVESQQQIIESLQDEIRGG